VRAGGASTPARRCREATHVYARGLVDLERQLRALLAPLMVGDELLPGARFVESSTEFGLRLSFAVGDEAVHVELEPVAEGIAPPHAARTPRFFVSYRVTATRARLPPQLGPALCRRVVELLRENEEEVLRALAAEGSRATQEGGTRIRRVEIERLLVDAGTPGARYRTLSPYVGCLVGCRFCYAQSRLASSRRLLGLADVPWGSYVDARINAPEVLARELAARPPLPLKFCPIVSDPYHAIERTLGLTRACLEVLARPELTPPATFVLTRAALVERDLELLASLRNAHVGFSIPTHDDALRAHFEPRAAPIAERVRVLRVFRAHGVRTFAMVQPILTDDVEALADLLAGCADSVRLDVLRGVYGAADDFADPRHAPFADAPLQTARADALAAALVARGVALWPDELPHAFCKR
jgi:DNA repair photolyase